MAKMTNTSDPLTQINGQTGMQNMIFILRGRQVMIDRDIASLYQVETKVLNQAVKRNIDRFPKEFRFQLNDKEKNQLVTNCDRLNSIKHNTINPYAFTEQGVSMLSAILKSPIAIRISVQIMKAFVELRKYHADNCNILKRLDHIEHRHFIMEKKFDEILEAFYDEKKLPDQGIFFDGQVFEAFVFVSDLIKSAEHSIILIDNYVDEQVLALLSKKKNAVRVLIYTHKISDHLKLAIKHFNEQFPTLKIKPFKRSHDRFLIIDEKEVYHIGASLKDLGKKWFAFSKLDIIPSVILNEIPRESE